jgi:aspartyl-tRNA synthetase
LPLEIVTKKTPAELVTRLDHRILDLRKPEIASIFNISDTLKRSFFDYFDDQGFIDVNTPSITGAAAEGGATMFPVDYFGKKAYLNQSPQLYKQMLLATGFDKITIVSNVFRAEPHETTRHINEVLQLDMEEAFIRNEEDVLKHFDGYFKYFIKILKKNCKRYFEILDKKIPSVKTPIKRVTYDEALKILKSNGVTLKWGEDLTPEAERVLCKRVNPVIVTKWPTAVKPFYCMNDGKYCRAFDLLFNGVELSSGAQREHRYDELIKNMKRQKLNPKDFKFYLEPFKFGMPSHGGWSIGLERLTMLVLKLKNIREATLFPRTKERLFP